MAFSSSGALLFEVAGRLGSLKSPGTYPKVKPGIRALVTLATWYLNHASGVVRNEGGGKKDAGLAA